MLIDMLQKKEEFTSGENLLCEYILDHFDDFSTMSLRQLAEKAYVSPPTVTRLCHKLGYQNFTDFKVKLVAEYVERKKQLTRIDYNTPFKREDSTEQVVDALSKISKDAIDIARKDFDYNTIQKVLDEIERLKYIDIYASGLSYSTAKLFAEKMTRIGYITTVTTGSEAYIRAKQSDGKRVFAIVITYSNETSHAKRCVDYLCESKVRKMLLTGNRFGGSVPKSEYVYMMVSDEQIMMENKMDAMGEIIMLHYILDCIYALMFHRNFEKNMKKIQETSVYQKHN